MIDLGTRLTGDYLELEDLSFSVEAEDWLCVMEIQETGLLKGTAGLYTQEWGGHNKVQVKIRVAAPIL